MNDKKFAKYVALLHGMCTDFGMGGITRGTFTSNLKLIVRQIDSDPISVAGAGAARILDVDIEEGKQ